MPGTLDEILSKTQGEEPLSAVDLANYKDATDFPPPFPAGEYTFLQGKPEFDITAGGDLSAIMHHKVTGGDYDNRQLMYDRVSTKPFDRDGVTVSMAGDHLIAIGSPDDPQTRKEWGQFFLASDGKPFNAKTDWEASCPLCYEKAKAEAGGNSKDIPKEARARFTVKGEVKFPMAESGGRQPFVPCPNCGVNIDARSRITRRIRA